MQSKADWQKPGSGPCTKSERVLKWDVKILKLLGVNIKFNCGTMPCKTNVASKRAFSPGKWTGWGKWERRGEAEAEAEAVAEAVAGPWDRDPLKTQLWLPCSQEACGLWRVSAVAFPHESFTWKANGCHGPSLAPAKRVSFPLCSTLLPSPCLCFFWIRTFLSTSVNTHCGKLPWEHHFLVDLPLS